jgi:peptidyl-prolyl cis-trans isomerase B (cyclophilin B)
VKSESRPRLRCAALAAAAVLLLGAEAQRSLEGGKLAALLASPDASIAARAALAVGRTKRKGGIPLLEAHLTDPRDGVRAFSIYGLGLIGLGDDASKVMILAGSDRSGAVRVAALDALGRAEEAGLLHPAVERAAATATVRALDGDPDPIVRGRAAITLSFFAAGPQGGRAAGALASAMGSERDPAVRRRAMWSIFRRYATRVPHRLLREALHDPDEVVRIEAARAYGHLSGAAARAELRPLLADASWRVQEQAAESERLLAGGAMNQHWTAIPPFVHVPSRRPDPLAALAALSRPPVVAGAPRPADAPAAGLLAPSSAAQMVSPVSGPHPRLRIRTTQGNLYVVLYPEWAPLTVTNFLNLTDRGFFDDNRWFRIVPDFVVQTGEKDDKNAPGPGYTIDAEENPIEQDSYVISMGLNYDAKTNTPIRDSAGSEYYVTLSPQYHLDNAFTVFGAVSGGYDVLGRLTEKDRVIRIERIPDVTL